MDNVQTVQVGSRLCAIVLSMTVGSMSPALAATQSPDFAHAAKAYAAAARSAYMLTGLQPGSQSTQKITAAARSDDFFQSFGKSFDSKQTGLSSADHQLIWDNLDYLLS